MAFALFQPSFDVSLAGVCPSATQIYVNVCDFLLCRGPENICPGAQVWFQIF